MPTAEVETAIVNAPNILGQHLKRAASSGHSIIDRLASGAPWHDLWFRWVPDGAGNNVRVTVVPILPEDAAVICTDMVGA